MNLIERLIKIADAGRYPNGSDCPLSADCCEAANQLVTLTAQLTAMTERAERAEAHCERIKGMLSDGGHELEQSEQAWKKRALRAEAVLAQERKRPSEEEIAREMTKRGLGDRTAAEYARAVLALFGEKA